MKKFNLAKEIMVFNRQDILAAIASNKEFGLTTTGDVEYPPFNETSLFIFKGKSTPPKSSALSIPKPVTLVDVIGNDYRVVEDEGRILIKAGLAWNGIISFNNKSAEYDDTTADGIAEFKDKELEAIGWHADEFKTAYRELVEVMEEKCEGTILCIEQEEPYQFSGLGFVSDLECARKEVFAYAQAKAADKIKNDDEFKIEMLTDDEEEAARFFKVI